MALKIILKRAHYMNQKSTTVTNTNAGILHVIGWIFGILFFAIGLINTCWGNDPGFGIFIVLLSFAYFPPVNTIINKKTGFAIPKIVKVLLAIFILWAALGVGELFDKIDLMLGR